jgi:hypothetical protein
MIVKQKLLGGFMGSPINEIDACPICLVDFTDENPKYTVYHPAAPTISHCFHKHCIAEVCKKAIGSVALCPMCRRGIERVQPTAGNQLLMNIADGDYAHVEDLLQTGLISKDDLGHAVNLCAYYGAPDVLTQLLAGERTISDPDRGDALCQALRNKDRAIALKVATQLLKSGQIPKEHHRLARKLASEKGYPEIKQMLGGSDCGIL